MNIREEYRDLSGAEVWQIVADYVKANGSFTSVTGIKYSATFVGSCIFVKGGSAGTKRAEKGEYLTGKDFIAAYDVVRTMKDFNTNKIKPYIKRQQTPFAGLLVCAGIIDTGEGANGTGEPGNLFE